MEAYPTRFLLLSSFKYKGMLNSFVTAYEVLHLAMAYDGAKSAKLATLGMEEAEEIMKWAENRIAA